ncbi:proenkephalin-A-like [Mugil cephalus]|uniref:proenkephalin-A-like n=1 Tax=Mugil cephalus TaxID=48193 RepID=UPI001FB8155B|nr:proenkephalin-A-like [Mugil cephalus]
MAVPAHSRCMWMLVLGICVSLVVGIECRKECTLCLYGLLGRQSGFSSLTCSLECKDELDSQKLHLCHDLMLKEDNHSSLDVDPLPQQQQEAAGVTTADSEDEISLEHQLTKKYGGFMKRYGGFMSRRSPSAEAQEELSDPDAEETICFEILKILKSAGKHSSEGDDQEGKAVKRYGGFMRRADLGEEHRNLLEAVLGRGLKKRYGGFMRRVGRPEWLVDSSKNDRVLRQAWENGSELQKRYGGFMD